MQTVQALIMGTIQGLTEFLPVSSSGHIVLSSAIYKLLTGSSVNHADGEEVFFDILIHLATLLAIFIYFRKDLKQIFKGIFSAFQNKDFQNKDFKLGTYIVAATFVTCLFGLLIKDFAHNIVENPFYVSLFLIFTGFVLFFSEKFKGKKSSMNLKNSLFIGLFQGLALLPGVSRSGMTISSAVFQGIERVEAAKFSFILSIPIILIASFVYPLLTFDLSDIKNFNFGAIFTGMAVSFVVGYFCIKYFMKFLEKSGLKIFAFYCFLVGIVCAFIFF